MVPLRECRRATEREVEIIPFNGANIDILI
jgi:hypothetical protein